MVIALIVTPDGFPLAYEVMPGNTTDQTTLAGFLEQIEQQYGRSQRVWIMDRGMRRRLKTLWQRLGELQQQANSRDQMLLKLGAAKQAFKDLKHDLAIRPVFHQREARIEAHLFVSFSACCLHVTLKNLARPHAPGLTPHAILETFATLQMVDVHLPTTDGRHLVLPRHTRPNREHALLLHQLNLQLPTQPAPRLTT